jgi:Ca2+-binding RTX toxin-like protein
MISTGGTNHMFGGSGTNVMIGGVGSSDMHGGGGVNVYYTGADDTIVGAGTYNTDILLATGVTLSLGQSDVQQVILNGGANSVDMTGSNDFVYLYGGAGINTMMLGAGGGYELSTGGTNHMFGGSSGMGIDVFVGGAGTSDMHGGNGYNDYYAGADDTVAGAGIYNTLIEEATGVDLTLGSPGLSDVQQFILDGGNNTVDASSAAWQVFFYGGSGNDTMLGGAGNDFLYGGGGTNTFRFQSGWGQDTIVDWTTGTNNQIDLTALAGLGVHAVTDLTQTITGGNDVITSSHTGTNSITLMGVGSALSLSSFHFA